MHGFIHVPSLDWVHPACTHVWVRWSMQHRLSRRLSCRSPLIWCTSCPGDMGPCFCSHIHLCSRTLSDTSIITYPLSVSHRRVTRNMSNPPRKRRKPPLRVPVPVAVGGIGPRQQALEQAANAYGYLDAGPQHPTTRFRAARSLYYFPPGLSIGHSGFSSAIQAKCTRGSLP